MSKIVIERYGRDIRSLHLCKNQTEAAKAANNLLLKFLRELGLSEDQIDDALECGDAGFCDDCGIAFRDGAWYCEQGNCWDTFICDLPDGDARYALLEFEDESLLKVSFMKEKGDAVAEANESLCRWISEIAHRDSFDGSWQKADGMECTPRAYLDWNGGDWEAWDAYVIGISEE